MGRKRNERERIDTGLRYLTEGLAPFVDRHMTARHGPDWLAEWNRRDSEKAGYAKTSTLADPQFLLKMIRNRRDVFGSALSGLRNPSDLAQELLDLRNLINHDYLQTTYAPGEAARALEKMAELLRAAGAADKAQLVLDQVPGRPTPAPRRKAKARRRQAPKPPERRRRFPGVLALAAAGAVAITVGLVAANRPGADSFADVKVGAQLGDYPAVTLRDGYHLSLLDEPATPRRGPSGGDLAYSGGVLSGRDTRIVLIGPRRPATYATCRAAARPAHTRITAKYVVPGTRFCVTTSRGAVGLVRVTGGHRGRNVVLALKVWKGPQPAA
ncbi:hypothetical protein GCM10009530_08960 [Microbispora corallina]|uniref:Swt1-like HEPN domain-containing protein n=1 Tax=Microbispora corallina TaxID=83302 RepID=A0ABQ4FVL3_9ACTN|nr:Swt1 family HEPN domain-containing protein [Microbispora corallina]GIH38859.1 hypothetical protein Mco01_18590 [Microbispora corallina]